MPCGCAPSALRTDRRGFTLIEVLVVVAIIAVLVSILLPSLGQVRWQTKNAACKANLHDLGTAFTIYAEMYKGYFPVTPNVSSDSYWSLYKARLLPDTSVLICPATKNVIRSATLKNPVTYVDDSEDEVLNRTPVRKIEVGTSDIDDAADNGRDDAAGGHSYEYNGFYNGDGGLPATRKSGMAGCHKKKDHFKFPPHLLFLVHDNDDDFGFTSDAIENLGCVGVGENNCPQPWDNHGEKGMNMMFADGHAEWMKKFAGEYLDMRDDPPTKQKSPNATIERVWLRGQYPWVFIR